MSEYLQQLDSPFLSLRCPRGDFLFLSASFFQYSVHDTHYPTICKISDCRVRFFNIQEGGRNPPGFSRMSSPRRRGSPFVFRYPHCGCSGAAPAKPCKASAAAMLAWLWSSRRGFCNARACKCNMLFTKKARNFLAKDGPGSFDQPSYNVPIFIRKVDMLSFFQLGIPSGGPRRGVFGDFSHKNRLLCKFLLRLGCI